jgi:hypothetical protein
VIRRGLAAVAAAALLVVLTLPLTARPASACDVSYGYKPSLRLDRPNLGRGEPCSLGTSMAGAFFVALLALGAVVAGGVLAYRRAEALLRSPVPPPAGPGRPAPIPPPPVDTGRPAPIPPPPVDTGHPAPIPPPPVDTGRTGPMAPPPEQPWPGRASPRPYTPGRAAPDPALVGYLSAAGIAPPAPAGHRPAGPGAGPGAGHGYPAR